MTKDEIRERIVELICGTHYGKDNKSLVGENFQRGFIEKIADHLVAHGVTFAETDGCGYCDVAKAYNDFPFINKNAEVDKWTMMGKKLKYCPMCGRQLPEQQKEN